MRIIILISIALLFLSCSGKSQGKIYLTFDDGPSLAMDTMLNILKAYNVKATFFVKGAGCDSLPNIVRRAVKEGHLIGTHSNKHPNFTTISNDSIRKEIINSISTIKRVTGVDVQYFRFPFLAYTTSVRNWVENKGLTHATITIEPADWNGTRSAVRIQEWVISQLNLATPNVVLLHTIPDKINPAANTTSTSAALPGIIEEARALGYGFYILDNSIDYRTLTYINPTN